MPRLHRGCPPTPGMSSYERWRAACRRSAVGLAEFQEVRIGAELLEGEVERHGGRPGVARRLPAAVGRGEQDDIVAPAGQPQARQRHAGAPGGQACSRWRGSAPARAHPVRTGGRGCARGSSGRRAWRRLPITAVEVTVPHFVRFRPMSTTAVPVLAALIGRLAAAVPGRARATFTGLLIGAAVTRGGHVTDAILAVGLSRAWTTYCWLLERGRWSWLSVWRALLGVLEGLFAPPVWHVVIDDTVVERISAAAPGSLIHHNHSAKPNRPRFLRGQGWLCLAAVVERGWRVGAVPLMLRLVRRGTHRGKLRSARFLLRLLGPRLGRVRVLLDAWFMRARLIEAALADGHTVIGRARRDLALYAVPRPPRRRRRGRPRKYGPRMTRERIEALPVHRSARILY